jgi:hypothetical protein
MNTTFGVRSSILITLASLIVSLPARADELSPDSASNGQTAIFGQAGQIVFSNAAQFTAEHMSFSSPSEPSQSMTGVFVTPSADVFVVRGLSVGGAVAYYHSEISGGSAALNGISVGPRIGYDLPLGDHFSLWSVARVAYGETWLGGTSSQGLSVGGYAPVLYHPVAHFFFGLGPNVSYSTSVGSVAPGASTTQYGLSLTVGGWLKP